MSYKSRYAKDLEEFLVHLIGSYDQEMMDGEGLRGSRQQQQQQQHPFLTRRANQQQENLRIRSVNKLYDEVNEFIIESYYDYREYPREFFIPIYEIIICRYHKYNDFGLQTIPETICRAIAICSDRVDLLDISIEGRDGDNLPWMDYCDLRFPSWRKNAQFINVSKNMNNACELFYYLLCHKTSTLSRPRRASQSSISTKKLSVGSLTSVSSNYDLQGGKLRHRRLSAFTLSSPSLGSHSFSSISSFDSFNRYNRTYSTSSSTSFKKQTMYEVNNRKNNTETYRDALISFEFGKDLTNNDVEYLINSNKIFYSRKATVNTFKPMPPPSSLASSPNRSRRQHVLAKKGSSDDARSVVSAPYYPTRPTSPKPDNLYNRSKNLYSASPPSIHKDNLLDRKRSFSENDNARQIKKGIVIDSDYSTSEDDDDSVSSLENL